MRVPYKNTIKDVNLDPKYDTREAECGWSTLVVSHGLVSREPRTLNVHISRLTRKGSAPACCASGTPNISLWGHHLGDEVDLDQQTTGS